ncbi:endonuclease domain-containing protein [Virgibacillus halodenitrificans]|uniref:DUF559 domain-containing protein n=1 Tax=Virgibacillus halodenitrificans TaxID=1482 RepID=A0ABR7VR68_VIRHA|nr:DUF559 domain-containing protein [Virgibacillus halodenitrificans]MBD1223262.1 DUF559 domain-containing protein [Virgibacillus halodenitrificans]
MAKDSFDKYIEHQVKAFKKLPKRVRDEINERLTIYKASFVTAMEGCESPIEQLMIVHLIDLEQELMKSLFELGKKFEVYLKKQEIVETENGKRFRLDFSVECSIEEENYKFAIECDGHDFHEKTKEQVTRDKSRDRDLTKLGYTVIRFSGSEIWKDPSRCVREVGSIINKTTGIDDFYQKMIVQMYER